MSKENKLVEESKDNKPSSGDNKKRSKRCEEPFPPKLRLWQYFILVINYIAVFLAALYLVEQFCSIHTLSLLTERSDFLRSVCRPCVWGTYIAFSIVVAVIVIHYCVWNKIIVHKARLEDRSEVESTIVEALTVEPRLKQSKENSEEYDRKKKELMKEVNRIRELGENGWTEYQVLSLNQLLIDFLKPDELKARAQSSLEDLQEYTDDRYDLGHYTEWKDRIYDAIEKIDETNGGAVERDDVAEILRGKLRTLLEHVADYERYWAQGSAIIRNVVICGVMLIPLLVTMGLLPLLHPSDNGILRIGNWALLGMSGALTAILKNLHRSNLVEVGNTKGREALLRTFLAATLGLVAGILGYSLIAGGLVTNGSAVPKIESAELRDVGLSILWAIASGFCFESVFNRIRNATVGGS